MTLVQKFDTTLFFETQCRYLLLCSMAGFVCMVC